MQGKLLPHILSSAIHTNPNSPIPYYYFIPYTIYLIPNGIALPAQESNCSQSLPAANGKRFQCFSSIQQMVAESELSQ